MQILLTIDFSPASLNAAEFAINLFSKTDNQFILIHGFPGVYGKTGYANQMELQRQEQTRALGKLGKLKRELKANWPEAKISAVANSGFVDKVIRDAIRKYEADLVVFGNDGAHSWLSSILNSTVAQLNNQIRTPIMVVPAKASFKVRHLFLAWDKQKLGNVQGIKVLKRLQRRMQRPLTVMHVNTPDVPTSGNEDKPSIEQLTDLDVEYNEINHDNILGGLISGIQDKQDCLLCIVEHEETTWQKVFKTSKTDKLMIRSDIPLLILKEETWTP